jgi:phosphoribosyl-dephospho-CoA transferase
MTAGLPPVHRHQLVWLTDAGWRDVLARGWDTQAQDCLQHWAQARLPLVVTQQKVDGPARAGGLALGLAAPCRWQRRRIALRVQRTAVAGFDEFPHALDVQALLSPSDRPAWARLMRSLGAAGATPRVYGSHGWQLVSGLPCLRPGSDIDLWLAVEDARQADAAAERLLAFPAAGAPRLDGELVFPGGLAFAWREWLRWRIGQCRSVLAKTLHGPRVMHAWPEDGAAATGESAAWGAAAWTA